MRKTTFLAVIVAASVFAAGSAGAEVGKSYTIVNEANGTVETVVCTGDTSIDAVEEVQGSVVTARWDPACSSFDSGFPVTYTNTGAAPHDPGSELDNGACFRGGGFNGDLGHNMATGETYTVQLKYESGQVSSRHVRDDGTFGDWRSCPGAIDLSQSGAHEAVIPYRCFLHAHMQGLLVVEATGIIG